MFKRYPKSDKMLAVEGCKRGILVKWRVPSGTPAFVKNFVTKEPDISVIRSKERLDRRAYAWTRVKQRFNARIVASGLANVIKKAVNFSLEELGRYGLGFARIQS